MTSTIDLQKEELYVSPFTIVSVVFF